MTTLRTVAYRSISPHEVMLGGIWVGPGGGRNGDGHRADRGQQNADSTVLAAVKAGIRDFDTAPWYGFGASEERLGRALQKLSPTQLSEVRLITKAGRLIRRPDGTPAVGSIDTPGEPLSYQRHCVNDFTVNGAMSSLTQSLTRMGLTTVAGLRIHDPNDNSLNRIGQKGFKDEVALALDKETGMCAELRRLRDAKVIAHVGIGMNCNREDHQGAPEEVIRLLQGCEGGTFNSALLAGGWNLLSQEGLPCLLECQERGVEVHVAGVFASGFLVDQKAGTYAYTTAPPEVVARARCWKELAEKWGYPLPAVAVAFASFPSCVTRVVIGMASPEQVAESLAWVAASCEVDPAIWLEAKELGLLGKAVPTPSTGERKSSRARMASL